MWIGTSRPRITSQQQHKHRFYLLVQEFTSICFLYCLYYLGFKNHAQRLNFDLIPENSPNCWVVKNPNSPMVYDNSHYSHYIKTALCVILATWPGTAERGETQRFGCFIRILWLRWWWVGRYGGWQCIHEEGIWHRLGRRRRPGRGREDAAGRHHSTSSQELFNLHVPTIHIT